VKDQQQHEKKLIENEQLLRVFIDSAPVAIIVTDSTHKVLQWNRKAELIFGYTFRDVIHKQIYDFIIPDHLIEYYKKDIQNYMNTGKSKMTHANTEMPAKHKLGHEFIIDISITPYRMNDSWHFMSYIADITEVKKIEERLLRKEYELAQSKIIDEKKNEFLSIASHELKTPLTIVKAYTQLALAVAEKSDDSDLSGYLTKVDSQAYKLQLLIQQLLDISKMQRGTMEYNFKNAEIKHFLEDTVSSMQRILPNKLNTYINHNAIVKMDVLRIEQVLSNLLNNASKYSPRNVPIDISTAIIKNRIAVAVTDYGVGISEENLDKIFDRFYRVDSGYFQTSGLGMGLFIAQSIMKGHGGDIWAHSEVGKGSTFYFYLPFIQSVQPATVPTTLNENGGSTE
jgi:PAS domain S-box-containing protein